MAGDRDCEPQPWELFDSLLIVAEAKTLRAVEGTVRAPHGRRKGEQLPSAGREAHGNGIRGAA
uniref:Uncharacterized protein n=1 Tax=Tetraselmis sp. GSL018 TaxID=582737 RepID=A0A061SDM8_9CHLO